MGTVVYCTGLVSPRLGFCSKKIVGSSVGVQRQQVLEQVDKELSKGDERAALSLVKDLQGKPGGLRCFGAARQIPQRLYTLDELKLNGIQTRSLLSPVDATLGAIERSLQIAGVAGGLATWNAFGFSTQQILLFSLGLLFLWTLDSVSSSCLSKICRKIHLLIYYVTAGSLWILNTLTMHALILSWFWFYLHTFGRNCDLFVCLISCPLAFKYKVSEFVMFLYCRRCAGLPAPPCAVKNHLLAIFLYKISNFLPEQVVSFNGGLGSLVLDTVGHTFSQKYHNRVIQHEAGHFLIAYMVGILPRGYTLTSLEALQKDGSLNVQAGTAFVDFEFLEEVNTGKVSATTLNRFSCIALAGVAAEYVLFGYAEGGLADINKLDMLIKGLGFTQKKEDSQVRWSVLNTILMLRRHEGARAKLAEAMAMGLSVGSCIGIIEDNIDDADI